MFRDVRPFPLSNTHIFDTRVSSSFRDYRENKMFISSLYCLYCLFSRSFFSNETRRIRFEYFFFFFSSNCFPRARGYLRFCLIALQDEYQIILRN